MVETVIWLVVGLVILGFVAWALTEYIPMSVGMKQAVQKIAILGAILIAIVVLLPILLSLVPGSLP